MKAKKLVLALILIILLGLFLRAGHLGFRSVWGDEADSIFNTYDFASHGYHFSAVGIMGSLLVPVVTPLSGSHMPIYYVLLSIWTKLFGIGEISLRSLSVVLGIASVPLIFLLAAEMFDGETGLLCAFLLSISPLAVVYSQEIRPYSFMLFFSLASALYFWRIFKGNASALNMIGYLLSSLALLFAHLYGVLTVSAYVLFLFIRAKLRERPAVVLCLLSFLALLIAAPVLLAALTMGLAKMSSAKYVDLPFSVFPVYLRLPLYFFVLCLGDTVAPWNFLVVVPAVVIFGALFLKACADWRDERTQFLLVACVFPLIFSLIFLKLTIPKYLIICLPFFILLLTRSLLSLPGRFIKGGLIFCIVLIQLAALSNYFSLKEYHNSNQIEPWRQVSANIEERFAPGDAILTTNYDIAFRVLNYYLNILHSGNYPVFFVDDASALGRFHNKRIWLVEHIHDTKMPERINAIFKKMSISYRSAGEDDYVPYSSTVVSSLPINRYSSDEYRIRVFLYVKR